MEIKLNRKFIKLCVAAIALITTTGTLSPTTINNVTSVSAKAKKHHKKVKKTKKSKKKTYVIAKYYDEFKPGYSYSYDKKKGVFIGHKMKKRHSSTTDSDEPKVEQATSTYDVPKVKKFTKKIKQIYDLQGTRWAKVTITYNTNQFSNQQQQIADDAIKQINDLNIIKLKRTNKSADITIENTIKNTTNLADSRIESMDSYKGLKLTDTTTIHIYNENIIKRNNYQLTLNNTIIHEIGHTLGLAHTNKNNTDIMAPYSKPISNDNSHSIIDQDYINGLAILYQN